MRVATAVVTVLVAMGAANDAITARAMAANAFTVTSVNLLNSSGFADIDRCEAAWHGFGGWCDEGQACANCCSCHKCCDFHDFSFSLLPSLVMGSSV